MNLSSPATETNGTSPARNPTADKGNVTTLLSSAPDLASIHAARSELLTAVSVIAVFSAMLSSVVGIRLFHMAAATGIGIVFSVLISVLFALAIFLGMGLLVRMHSRGNLLGEQLPVLRAVVQETLARGDQMRSAVQQDLESSVEQEEYTRATLTDAEEKYINEFHNHVAGLQAAGQVLGLDQLPAPSTLDIVAMSQPLRADVEPRLKDAEKRRMDIQTRLKAVVLTAPEAPSSPHHHSHAEYPGKPDFNWVDPTVLPEGLSANRK